MQRRTLGTREAPEGILEDAATPRWRAFAVTMVMTSSVFCCPVMNARM